MTPGMVAVGAGEGAAAMAEQLALEHVARDRRAVERDERLGGAVGIAVDGAGEDFLAGAAFAGDEHADVGGGDASWRGHQVAHGAADHGLSVLARLSSSAGQSLIRSSRSARARSRS